MTRANHQTILIVEDDLDTAEFFAEILEMEGYQTLVAVSGRAALDTLATQHCASRTVRG